MKEFQPADYVFTDENGKEYISTPEYNYMSDLTTILLLGALSPAIIGLVLEVYLWLF